MQTFLQNNWKHPFPPVTHILVLQILLLLHYYLYSCYTNNCVKQANTNTQFGCFTPKMQHFARKWFQPKTQGENWRLRISQNGIEPL